MTITSRQKQFPTQFSTNIVLCKSCRANRNLIIQGTPAGSALAMSPHHWTYQAISNSFCLISHLRGTHFPPVPALLALTQRWVIGPTYQKLIQDRPFFLDFRFESFFNPRKNSRIFHRILPKNRSNNTCFKNSRKKLSHFSDPKLSKLSKKLSNKKCLMLFREKHVRHLKLPMKQLAHLHSWRNRVANGPQPLRRNSPCNASPVRRLVNYWTEIDAKTD